MRYLQEIVLNNTTSIILQPNRNTHWKPRNPKISKNLYGTFYNFKCEGALF